MGAWLHWTFDTSNLASMNSASSSALLTVITSDFERMSSAAPLPVLAGLWLLAHCGHVINRWVEMTSRKIPRNMEQMKAMTTHKNSRNIPRMENISELEHAVRKMMGYSKAPTSCACPPLSAPALDHFTHFSTISVAARPRTATMRNIFVVVGISVRNSIISLPPLLGDSGAEQRR